MQGTVKFFHDGDGYGFIETEEMDEDVFFHMSELPEDTEDPEEGDSVEFEQEEGDRGPKATNVEFVE
jgi:CspA family cold shock protein